MLKSTVAVVSLATLFAVAACDKEADKKQSASGSAVAPGQAPAPSANNKTPLTAEKPPSQAGGYGVFARDAELVLGINLVQMRGASFWPEFRKGFESEAKEFMAELAKCKIDFLESGTRMIAAGTPGDDSGGLAVVQGIEKSRWESCLDKVASGDSKKYTLKRDGNITSFAVSQKGVHAAWLSDTTVLLADGTKSVSWVKDRITGKDGLAGDDQFMDLLRNVDTRASAYFVALPRSSASQMGQAFAQLPTKPAYAFGSIKLTTSLHLDIGLGFDKEEDAGATKGLVSMAIGQFKGSKDVPKNMRSLVGLADKIKMTIDGKKLLFKLTLEPAELSRLSDAAKTMGGRR